MSINFIAVNSLTQLFFLQTLHIRYKSLLPQNSKTETWYDILLISAPNM